MQGIERVRIRSANDMLSTMHCPSLLLMKEHGTASRLQDFFRSTDIFDYSKRKFAINLAIRCGHEPHLLYAAIPF